MIKLSVHDSSVLTRLAQYQQLPEEDKLRILEETSTEEARQIGMILLGKETEADPEVLETARIFQSWAQKNRRDMVGRMDAFKKRHAFDTV